MKRTILAVICGVSASLLLITFFEWVKWRVVPYYMWDRETSHLTWWDWQQQSGLWAAYLAKYGGSLRELTWGAFWWHKLLFNPVIVLTSSVLVGLLAPPRGRRAGAVAVVSLAAFYLYSLPQPHGYFLGDGLLFCVPYAVLSYIAAAVTVRLRRGSRLS